MVDNDHVRIRLGRNIAQAVRDLLSDKHLYQSVNVDVAFLDEVAAAEHKAEQLAAARSISPGRAGRAPDVEQIRANLESFVRAAWFPSGARPLVDTGMDILHQNDPKVQKYPLPTVKLTCNHCGERGPCNVLHQRSERTYLKGWRSPVAASLRLNIPLLTKFPMSPES